jgi:hypothetical protein
MNHTGQDDLKISGFYIIPAIKAAIMKNTPKALATFSNILAHFLVQLKSSFLASAIGSASALASGAT